MLALEILKRIYANNPDTRFQRNNIDINFTIHDFSNVNEAIKELEALENRSCDNCKFKYVVDSMTTECQHNDSPIDYVDLDCFPTFSCNNWESK